MKNNPQEAVRYLHWIHLGCLVQVACCHPMDPWYNLICHHYLLFERRHPIDSSRQKREQDLYFLAAAIYSFAVYNSVQLYSCSDSFLPKIKISLILYQSRNGSQTNYSKNPVMILILHHGISNESVLNQTDIFTQKNSRAHFSF